MYGAVFVSVPHQSGLDTKVKWPEGKIIVEITGGKDQAHAEARALLDCAGLQPTWCNVGLMSLAGYRPKHGSRHGCLIIAWTRQQGPGLYKGDKGVNDAAHPPEGGPAEPGAFRPQVYLCWTMPAGVKAKNKLMLSASSPYGVLSRKQGNQTIISDFGSSLC